MNPNALLYRHQKGLVDYDERIAVLIQFVEGEQLRALFPAAGGRGGFQPQPVPLVAADPQGGRLPAPGVGAGHTAVETSGNDQPRLVALSHPLLLPGSAGDIRQHSQQFVDLLDLEDNTLKTLPVSEVLTARLPGRCARWPRWTRAASWRTSAPAWWTRRTW